LHSMLLMDWYALHALWVVSQLWTIPLVVLNVSPHYTTIILPQQCVMCVLKVMHVSMHTRVNNVQQVHMHRPKEM